MAARANLSRSDNTGPLYLVIDQGGHASRASLFNRQGELLSLAAIPIEAQVNGAGHVEYPAERLLQSIQQAIHEAVTSPNIKLTDIVAAGMATQRANVACWDRITGAPLAPLISWQDRRAADWIEKFRGDQSQIHQATGLFLSPHYGVGKLQWCIEKLPAVAAAAQQQRLCWGPMSSYLLHQLLDQKPYLVDHVNASRTLLWNIRTLAWDPALIALFSLPDIPLPQPVPNRYAYGSLTISGHSIPMMMVTGDQSASLFAWQELRDEALYINIGTGAFIQRVIRSGCEIRATLLTSLLLQQHGRAHYALEGTVNGAGSALSWIEQQLQPENLFQQLPLWLKSNDCPLLFINGISGLGSPYWQADVDSQFIGEGDEQQKVVAVIESIAFLLQVNIEQLQLHQPAASKILMSGGLAQLDGLCQRIADLSGLSILRMAECEATARGVAWLLARPAAESPASPEVRWRSDTMPPITPDRNPALIKRYQRWKIAMEEAIKT